MPAFRVSEWQLTTNLHFVALLPGERIAAGAYPRGRGWKQWAEAPLPPSLQVGGGVSACRVAAGLLPAGVLGTFSACTSRMHSALRGGERKQQAARWLQRPGRQGWGTWFRKMVWYHDLQESVPRWYLVYEAGLKWRWFWTFTFIFLK